MGMFTGNGKSQIRRSGKRIALAMRVQKTTLPPDKFQFAPEHPKPEHIDEEMSDPAMEKDVCERLPNAEPRNNSGRNQAEDLLKAVIFKIGTNKNLQQGLGKKNADTNQYEEFYTWGDKTPPVEGDAPRAVRWHTGSLRRQSVSVKVRFLRLSSTRRHRDWRSRSSGQPSFLRAK